MIRLEGEKKKVLCRYSSHLGCMLTVNHGERVDERLAGGEMRLVDGVARRRQRQANGDGVRLLVDGVCVQRVRDASAQCVYMCVRAL